VISFFFLGELLALFAETHIEKGNVCKPEKQNLSSDL